MGCLLCQSLSSGGGAALLYADNGAWALLVASRRRCYFPLRKQQTRTQDSTNAVRPSHEQRVMAEEGKQTLPGGHKQTSLMKDEQGKTTLACGHECTLYAGMAMSTSASSCWSKRSTKCCECMHTATEEPCIYIDGLGEQTCPRWQFYCAACVSRCAPDGGTMWDAGKMTRVLVFEPGTRMLMNAAPKAVTQTAAASQAKVAAAAAAVTAAAAPAAWLGVARQTLLAVKLAEQAQPVLAEQAQPVLAEQAQPVLAEQAQPALVPPRNAAAAAASHRKRSQPTARKPRHPGLVREGQHTPCTHHA